MPRESYKKDEIHDSDTNIDIDEFLREASEELAAGTLGLNRSQDAEIMKIPNHNSTDEGGLL